MLIFILNINKYKLRKNHNKFRKLLTQITYRAKLNKTGVKRQKVMKMLWERYFSKHEAKKQAKSPFDIRQNCLFLDIIWYFNTIKRKENVKGNAFFNLALKQLLKWRIHRKCLHWCQINWMFVLYISRYKLRQNQNKLIMLSKKTV